MKLQFISSAFILLVTAAMLVIPVHLFSQDEPVNEVQKFSIVGVGFSVLFPTGNYKDYTVRSPFGLDVSVVVPTRNPDFYAGGAFQYYFHDYDAADYLSTDADGWTTRLQEFVYNQQIALNGLALYMPDWFEGFQPYAFFQAGIRRVYSRVRIREYIDQSYVNAFTYRGTWMAQYGAGAGFKLRVGGLILDLNFSYLETTTGTHLLRKSDWRSIRADFATDYFDERRVPQQWLGFNIGINYIIF